jgi:Lrp/AsnC family transcriptional regulator, leucine-responsive regulatory protein
MKLDKTDRAILMKIQSDGRATNASLQFEREVQAIPRIVSCHNISGSADYLLQVVAKDLEDYGDFTRDVLRALPGVTAIESVLSLREVKRNGGLPLL